MATFVPIRTQDIVLRNGQQYLVTGVTVHSVKGVMLKLVPLGSETVTASSEEVQLASRYEAARRTGQPDKSVQRLKAAGIAQKAWEFGVKKAHTNPSIVAQRQPFTKAKIYERIKAAILETIPPEQIAPPSFLTQKKLDDVVRRIAASQGYMMTYRPNLAQARTKSEGFATWQDVATAAVRLGNAYNKVLMSRLDR